MPLAADRPGYAYGPGPLKNKNWEPFEELFWEQIILPVLEFDLSLTSINEQVSPCYTVSMNWCHLLAGIDLQTRTNCPETGVWLTWEARAAQSREQGSESWVLEAQTRGSSQSLMGPMLVCVPQGVVRSDQEASKSRIRPFLLLTLISVKFKCNVLPVKALQLISPWAEVCVSTHTGPAVHQIQSDLKNLHKRCSLLLHDWASESEVMPNLLAIHSYCNPETQAGNLDAIWKVFK